MTTYADNPDEYFDTYTEAGDKLSPQKRHYVHANGIWHKAVNVFLYRSNGNIILQQRSAEKTVSPLAWDLSVAEHLEISESWEAAAHRGLSEELGITDIALEQWGSELKERFDNDESNIHNYEFQRCYRGTTDQRITIDSAEVAAVREISPEDLAIEITAAPEKFTPWLLSWSRALKIIAPGA